MAVTKPVVLMFMIASFASACVGLLLAISVGSRDLLIITVPGFVMGAFFAFRYSTFDKSKAKEEEHRRSRNRHKH